MSPPHQTERLAEFHVESSHLAARSPSMRKVMRQALAIAHLPAPIVLLGETGTGKEVFARAIHDSSPRASRPFVPVNCGAIPDALLESELFGHARGAFSGAVADKPGLFEAASGGTLLLDEIADLPASLQVKLLRVLQDGQVRRVGSNALVGLDVRVMAATHKDLWALVEAGAFRADLYYRLNVFSLRLPALRERREDIVPLARHFLEQSERPGIRLAPAAEDLLWRYRWPGNIRELSNVIRYAAAMADGSVIQAHHLPVRLVRAHTSSPPPGSLRTLAEVEEEHVLSVLEACHGVQAAAARILGIGRTTLWRKLSRYGDRFAPGDPDDPVEPGDLDPRDEPPAAAQTPANHS
jgi:two-component system response regulator HydG